jgi:TonB family protein
MNRYLMMLMLLAGVVLAQDGAPAENPAAPDVEPQLLHFAEAVYPPNPLKNGREGTVLLEMLVTANGLVDSVLVVESLDSDLDQAAVEAAFRCTFSPAMVAGQPVPVYLQFAYTFSVAEQIQAMDPRVNFQGLVLEMGTGQPVAGAMVVVSFDQPDTTALNVPWHYYLARIGEFENQFLEEGRLVTFADSTGVFDFRSLPPGQLVLTFPNSGYAPLSTREEVRPNELIDGIFRLQRTQYNEYEVVVYGKGPEKEVSRQSLSLFEVERLPGFGGDVIKSLQALPGVARPTMNNPGAIIVRGSGNYDTRFLLDGIDIPLLFHFGGVKSTYNSLSLGSVNLYPGGFGTRYGGSVGGVVELTSRPARDDRWHTILDASLLDASFHTEGPLGKGFGLTLSGRRSFVGELANAALKNNDEVTLSVAPYYWDTVARLDYGRGSAHEFFLTFFAANDRMKMIVPDADVGSPEVNEATDSMEMSLSFSRLIFGYDADIGSRMRNELRVSAGRDKNSVHFLGEFRFDGEGPVYNLRDDLAYFWSPEVVTHVGVDAIYSPFDYAVKVNGYQESSSTGKEYSDLGSYVNVEYRPMPDVLLTAGVRYDYYHHLDEGLASVRASARWDYREDRTITASAGTYNQSPQPMGQSTDPIYGNPDLPPTLARHLTLGHEWRLGDRLSLKVEGYHNTQDQVPAFADTNDINFLADAEARMYGLEFMLRHQSDGGFFGWISYSVGRSQRRFARDPGDGSDWDSSDWALHDMDQTHHLEAVGSWELGKNWSFGSRVQYVSGVPVTPILGYTGNTYEFDADIGDYVAVEGEYLSERIEPYFRTDLRIDKKFIRESSIWSVYLDLQNANYFVYNSPEGYTYNYDFSKRNEYGWIFMPALGVRVEF